uniref:Chitin-binding type-2 domain-containing protein n=1 Tax=Anopheles funestus TaxID=62324 RepID=A0A182RF55_ANOFN
MAIGVGNFFLIVLIIESAKITGATSVQVQTNETGVCEAKICSKLEYYDKLKQKCRDFPGGGFLVIMDHSTKCAHGDSGLHTFSRRDFYYVCHPDGVMIGLCPENTVFSDTEKRCIGQTFKSTQHDQVHDESRNCNIIVPDCSGVVKFPFFQDCFQYHQIVLFTLNVQNITTISINTFISVLRELSSILIYKSVHHLANAMKRRQVITGKTTLSTILKSVFQLQFKEEILHNFSKDYFPECHMYGQFRTAKDCMLYYRCVPNIDGSFYQIRYECPYNMYYNIEKEICVPEHLQCCDYIPHERIIENYKQQHNIDSSTLKSIAYDSNQCYQYEDYIQHSDVLRYDPISLRRGSGVTSTRNKCQLLYY